MDLLWIGNVRTAFVRVYGENKGISVCNVVIPAVMGDFRRTVLAAAPGEAVTETYRTDDRKTDVTITGYKQADVCVIQKIEIGGNPVDLGSGPLIL